MFFRRTATVFSACTVRIDFNTFANKDRTEQPAGRMGMRCSESAVGYATAQEIKKNQATSQHRI